MASTTHTRPASRRTGRTRRHLDMAAIIAESLRFEEDSGELALEESAFCRMIETDGVIGRDPELGMAA